MHDNDKRKILDLSVNEFFNMLEERSLKPIKESICKISTNGNDLLSYEEAATYIDCYRQKIYSLVSSKDLTAIKKRGHKQKYIRRCQLDSYLQKNNR